MLEKKKGCCEKCKGKCKSYGVLEAFSFHNIHICTWLSVCTTQNAFTMASDMRAEQNGQTQTIHAPVINVLPALWPNRISNATHHVIIHCYQGLASAVRPAWVSCSFTYFHLYLFMRWKLKSKYAQFTNMRINFFVTTFFVHTSMTNLTCQRFIEKLYKKKKKQCFGYGWWQRKT